MLPVRVQQGAFGTRDAAPAGGTITAGRLATPRPALVQRGTAQGEERFVTKEGELDAFAVARALNQAQRNIDNSTAAARANPTATGHLFQGVKLQGPLMTGSSAAAPPSTGLPVGYQYWNTDTHKPNYYDGAGQWRDSAGTVLGAASSAAATYTIIEHGFGAAATGIIITNVSGGVIGATHKIVPAGDATDKQRVRIWTPVLPDTGATLTADVYVFF